MNCDETMSASLSYFGVPCWVWSSCCSVCLILLKMRLETSMWKRKMKERGRMRVKVICEKIFRHEKMILKVCL